MIDLIGLVDRINPILPAKPGHPIKPGDPSVSPGSRRPVGQPAEAAPGVSAAAGPA